jgi:uncharacterized membrane protein YfcA
LGHAVALQVPVLTAIDVYAAWLHSDHLDWGTVWLLLPPSFVGMALGLQIDRYMTDAAARVLVGILLLSILALRVWKHVASALFPAWSKRRQQVLVEVKRKTSFKEDDLEHGSTMTAAAEQRSSESASAATTAHRRSSARLLWACVVGLVGGMATMLTNSMGPILNVYLLSVRKLSPTAYIGTRAMFFCFLNLFKLPMRFASGTLGWSMMPLAAMLGLVSVAGVYCAKPIMLSMSETTFVKLELSVVAFAGLRLLWMGLHG